MMNKSKILSLLIVACAIIFQMTSCTDKCTEVSEFVKYDPVYIDQAIYEKEVQFVEARAAELTGVIYSYSNFLFVNEYNHGIHVIDNTNPAEPNNVGFLEIGNNKQFVIKDGHLIANRFGDIVVLDLQDLNNIKEIKRIQNVFEDETTFTDEGIISHYIRTAEVEKRDCEDGTVNSWRSGNGWFVNQDFAGNASTLPTSQSGISEKSNTGSGQGSSTARFTIANNHIYVLNGQSGELNIYDASNVTNLTYVGQAFVGGGSETLFPLNDLLFVGATRGMSMYNISNPANPEYLSEFQHGFACDPVVANENTAFVTLRSGTPCEGFSNQLDVINIENILVPDLVDSKQLFGPSGLTLYQNYLYVCDGIKGIVVFDVSNPNNVVEVGNFKNKAALDVLVVAENVLAVSSENEIYQLNIEERDRPKLLSVVTTK